ncbi:MSMEG_1061 family FMN-dependent PPOX-type flavoprotein [Granulosicoccus antarcticus]|uniref:MSMEG_1061 family FMN-dependent PPOX-type flavoprotein n=1 Tax=Granulosicoccus antarcticus TaxID=437505 RepID=UPI0012FE04AC|nr:MSMEG_1061 family FMN-dependent PPOX-type flavoprotein [Granulosicoccus antarcticus]
MNESHLITSLDELARIYPAPKPTSRGKIHDCLSEQMQRWLLHSPFFVLASLRESGIDCSPRGDAPGKAFTVLDAHTIAIPDRRGNNRIDTLRNLLIDSRVGLVFLIPGIAEALRIKGRAHISVDPQLLDRFSLEEVAPATVIIVKVDSAYVQNARAIRSSHLWDDDFLVDPDQVPSAADLSLQP